MIGFTIDFEKSENYKKGKLETLISVKKKKKNKKGLDSKTEKRKTKMEIKYYSSH